MKSLFFMVLVFILLAGVAADLSLVGTTFALAVCAMVSGVALSIVAGN